MPGDSPIKMIIDYEPLDLRSSNSKQKMLQEMRVGNLLLKHNVLELTSDNTKRGEVTSCLRREGSSDRPLFSLLYLSSQPFLALTFLHRI